MFSLINAARLYKINPDNALELTNQKFIRRFNYLEEHTIKEGKSLKDMSLEEMDAIWNEAKKKDCNFLTGIKNRGSIPTGQSLHLLKQSVCSYESDALFFFISSLNRLPCLCYDSYLLSFRGENASLHVAREKSSCLKESFKLTQISFIKLVGSNTIVGYFLVDFCILSFRRFIILAFAHQIP